MSSIANDIIAEKRKLSELLREKYTVDYFQREYKWERRHIEQLLIDLEASFLTNYEEGHTLANVSSYNNYYLGPVVICKQSRTRSIVDGQQRLTSITLLLIYLNNLQNAEGYMEVKEDIAPLIFSRKGGVNSYNIEVAERQHVLEALFTSGEFDNEDEMDLSVRNMYERYIDIVNAFSDELKGQRLPLFIEWLKDNVVFVEILAHSTENAYTIFETMNDRGLNLTPTEMLKGYILTNVGDPDRIDEVNGLWKKHVSNLHQFAIQEDQEFIRAWLRSAYAESIRSSMKGAENEDFEKIGTRFHTWVKDNNRKLGLRDNDAFYYFVKGDFDFYASLYFRILSAERTYTEGLEILYLSSDWSIANSLAYPLLMAPINKLDTEETIISKLNCVYRFLDIFTVSRSLNNKSITQTALRYTIYSLVKDIRNKNLHDLRSILREKLESPWEGVDALMDFNYRPDNKGFIHYLFARMIYYVGVEIAENSAEMSFMDLLPSRKRNRLVLAPILELSPEFEDLQHTYSLLGNYALIPGIMAADFRTMSIQERSEILSEYGLFKELEKGSSLSLNFFDPLMNADIIRERTINLMYLAKEIWNPRLI